LDSPPGGILGAIVGIVVGIYFGYTTYPVLARTICS